MIDFLVGFGIVKEGKGGGEMRGFTSKNICGNLNIPFDIRVLKEKKKSKKKSKKNQKKKNRFFPLLNPPTYRESDTLKVKTSTLLVTFLDCPISIIIS